MNDKILRIFKTGFSFGRIEVSDNSAFAFGTEIELLNLFFFRINQIQAIGTTNSNQKNSGFKNCILKIISLFYFLLIQ
jgi:hypothetical protein